MNAKVKEKIRLYMNVHELICDKRLPTDADWDAFFIKNYNDATSIHFYKEDFITYEIMFNCIYIKDMVSENNTGIYLINHVIEKSKELKLPIMAMVHKSNLQVLNVVARRYGFKIGNQIGSQFVIYREV